MTNADIVKKKHQTERERKALISEFIFNLSAIVPKHFCKTQSQVDILRGTYNFLNEFDEQRKKDASEIQVLKSEIIRLQGRIKQLEDECKISNVVVNTEEKICDASNTLPIEIIPISDCFFRKSSEQKQTVKCSKPKTVSEENAVCENNSEKKAEFSDTQGRKKSDEKGICDEKSQTTMKVLDYLLVGDTSQEEDTPIIALPETLGLTVPPPGGTVNNFMFFVNNHVGGKKKRPDWPKRSAMNPCPIIPKIAEIGKQKPVSPEVPSTSSTTTITKSGSAMQTEITRPGSRNLITIAEKEIGYTPTKNKPAETSPSKAPPQTVVTKVSKEAIKKSKKKPLNVAPPEISKGTQIIRIEEIVNFVANKVTNPENGTATKLPPKTSLAVSDLLRKNSKESKTTEAKTAVENENFLSSLEARCSAEQNKSFPKSTVPVSYHIGDLGIQKSPNYHLTTLTPASEPKKKTKVPRQPQPNKFSVDFLSTESLPSVESMISQRKDPMLSETSSTNSPYRPKSPIPTVNTEHKPRSGGSSRKSAEEKKKKRSSRQQQPHYEPRTVQTFRYQHGNYGPLVPTDDQAQEVNLSDSIFDMNSTFTDQHGYQYQSYAGHQAGGSKTNWDNQNSGSFWNHSSYSGIIAEQPSYIYPSIPAPPQDSWSSANNDKGTGFSFQLSNPPPKPNVNHYSGRFHIANMLPEVGASSSNSEPAPSKRMKIAPEAPFSGVPYHSGQQQEPRYQNNQFIPAPASYFTGSEPAGSPCFHTGSSRSTTASKTFMPNFSLRQ